MHNIVEQSEQECDFCVVSSTNQVFVEILIPIYREVCSVLTDTISQRPKLIMVSLVP